MKWHERTDYNEVRYFVSECGWFNVRLVYCGLDGMQWVVIDGGISEAPYEWFDLAEDAMSFVETLRYMEKQ